MKKNFFGTIVSVILILSLVSIPCFATGGNGSGGGNGGGSNTSLTVASSNLKDSSTDVELNKVIELKFSKNVADVSVCEQNSKKIQLTDSENKVVGIEVIFPDSQIKKEYRDYLFIKPLKDLKPDTDYKLTISSKIKSKSQSNLDKDYILNFKTGKKASSKGNATLQVLGEDIVSFKVTSAIKESKTDKKDKETTTKKKTTVEKEETEGLNNTSLIITIVVLVAVIASVVYFVTKSKKEKE